MTSLLAVVVVIAFVAGVAYGAVAIPSQTQLQEDLPEEVRGRVFGVLNMLVSVSSFLPIIIVGPISDLIGTARSCSSSASACWRAGIASVFLRDPNLGDRRRQRRPAFRGPARGRPRRRPADLARGSRRTAEPAATADRAAPDPGA